jgi:hypothetical protein
MPSDPETEALRQRPMPLKPRLLLHIVVCRLSAAPEGGTGRRRQPREEGSRR